MKKAFKKFFKSSLSFVLAFTIIFSSAIVGLGEVDFVGFGVGAKAANESGIVEFNGHYYQLFNESMTWSVAKDKCEELGGHLATISSQEEQDFINENLVKKTNSMRQFWLGGYYSSNKWCWVTGEDFQYTNWNPGEPTGGQYYLTVLGTFHKGCGLWLDNPNTGCSEPWTLATTGFICEWEGINQIESDYTVLSYSDLKPIDDSIVAYDNSNLKITASDYYSVDISGCTLFYSSVMIFGAIPTSTNSHISAIHCNGYDAIVEADNVKFPVSGQTAEDEKIININVYTDLENFSEFQLLQNGAVLQTSSTGSFSLRAKNIPTGDSLSVRVVDSDGKKHSKIKTNIKTYEAKTDFSVQGSKISITIPEDVFIVGGAEFDLNLEDLPVFIMRSDDSIKIGLGASETSEYIKNGETENSELWGDWKGLVDKLKNDYTDGVIDAKAYKTMHDLNMGKFFSSTGFVPEGTAKVCAYAEFRYVNGEWTAVGANGCMAVSFKVSNEWLTFVWSVPITIKLEGSLGANADFSVGFNFDEGRWYTEADIDFTLPEVRGSIGVGIPRVFDGSAYVKLKNNVKVSFKNEYVNCVLNGELGLSGKFLCFSGEKSLWNFMDWQYYYNSWATSSVSMPDYYSNSFSPTTIYDENVYSIDKREHLETQSEWYGAYNFSAFNLRGPVKYTEKLLQESVYEAVNPVTVTTSNGITMMVWTADIAERATGSHTALVYSVYDNAMDVWSEPQIICDDGTADSYPDVVAYGNNIYVTWVNVNKDFDETVTVEEMSSACEISVACYNAEASTFTKIADLTNDAYFNYLPVVAVKDDVLYVSYAENTENDPFTQKGDNSLYIASINADGTYTTEKVTSTVNPFTGLDIGFIDDNLTVAYLMDTDSDITTDEDVELFVYNNKQTVQVTDNDKAEQSVQFARINGTDYIAYYSGDNIYYFNNVSKINSISNTGNSALSQEYKFVDDKDGTVLVSKAISLDDDAANIYASVYSDSGWLTPVKVTSSEVDIKSFDVYKITDEGIGVVYSKSRIEAEELIEEENGKFKGTYKEFVDLYSTSFVRYSNISLNNVTINEEEITADGITTAAMSVTNNGLTEINSVLLDVQSNDEAVYQAEIEKLNLLPGETREINVDVLLGEIENLNSYNFIVSITDSSDIDLTNNEKTLKIGYVDIDLSLEKSVSDGNTSCVSVIKNNSCIPSDLEMVIRKNSYDGEIVQRTKLPAIGAFDEVKYYITPEIIADNFSFGDAVCVEIVATKDEKMLDNNYQFITVAKPETDIFEYSILENNCIKITKYNGNDDSFVIPKTFDDYTVVGIAANAIPANVTQVTIPETITNIHPQAFNSATKLQKINVDEDNDFYTAIDGVLYSKDETELVRLPIAYQGNFEFAENITTICECAFNGHKLSEEFNISETITTIEKSAFSKCTGIKYVFYTGTEEEWLKITIGSDNACLTNAYVHYETTEHIYSDEWTVDVAPTCTKVGSKSHKCKFCDCKIDVTEVPAKGHSYSTEWTVDLAPTCTKAGSKSHHCTVCDEKTDITVIDAVGHDYSTEWTIDIAVTCITDGSKSRHCTVCDDKIEITAIVAPGHSYSEDWIIDLEATCTENGSKSYHCAVCGDKKDVTVIPATGHNYSTEWTIDLAPTCTEEGSKSYHCLGCDDKKDITVILANGHSYGDWVIDLEATCTEDGSRSKTCTGCNDLISETIITTGHDYADEWTIDFAPTCIKNGYKSRHCTKCEDKTDEIVISPLGHSYGNAVIEREPTCTKTGSRYKVCSACNRKSTEVIPALGHSFSEEWTIDIPATCTTTGQKSHHCTECDAKTDFTVIDATGHNYVTTVEPTHPHTTTKKCSFCNDEHTEDPYVSNCVECNFTVAALDANSYKLVSYIGTGANVVVPTEYNGLLITKIEANCFKGNTTIKSVVIPEGITSMGNAVFYGCTNLESVRIPSTVASTGNAAFYNCTNLKSVKIADGVKTIGNSAFRGCTSLEAITIPESVTTIGAQAFYGFTGTIYCTKDSTAHNYAVANNIKFAFIEDIPITATENSQIDYENHIVKTNIQSCDDIAEVLAVSDSARIVVTASCKQGSNELLGTGSIISVYEGDTHIGDYTLVINGDTNGDSICDALDCFEVERVANGNSDLSGAYAMAADSNSDEVVDITDYQAIVNKALAS